MKRTFKRILPILLAVVVVCSIFWYLFVYDRGFTQDILLSSARYFEQQGNQNIATWLYKQAYQQSGNDDGVIIELSERFKKIGNFTQAEVVLTNAIKEGASVELYLALSKTYVEQDKLLDAVSMLENITNPEIKAQLDTMRPSTPVAAPAPGYYSQYLNVTIESNGSDRLFVATNGDFPSVKSPSIDSISLVGGENTISVIAVDESGLVSTPAHFSYIVGGVIEEVTISDSVLDNHFRELLNLGSEHKIYSDNLWNITSLTVPKDVKDHSSIGRLSYLQTLVIEDQEITGMEMFASLSQLKELTIKGCPLSASDLQVIGSLPNLERLTLSNCSLTNISGLSNATRLLSLDLSSNAIKDLSPLAFMDKLQELNLSSNALTNLSALSALESLTHLDVSFNSLTSIAPLSACSHLTTLVATNNQLTDIPVFADPTVLTALNLSNNEITNIQPLAGYISLNSLAIAYNKLTDVTPLASLDKLAAFDFSHNQVTTLPSFSKSCALVEINGSNNKITSVAPLRGLSKLNNVFLDNNKITNINPLAECQMLVRVSIYGNKVKDVSKLTEMSVIVNYTPK